jgi:hypothetical protein
MDKPIDKLEALVDVHGLDGVLVLLAEVCDLKAEHLRANWQDETSASVWDNYAHRIARLI